MLNRVDIIGHLGRDPETRYTAGGDAVCTLSVATTERWTDRATGERQESTEWHRVALFGKLAETAQRYLQRGGLVYVSGRIRTRQFTDAEGRGYALDLDPLPAGRAGQVIYLPIEGPTPEPDYPSFTAWFSEVAEKFAAGAFSVEDGDGIWLDDD